MPSENLISPQMHRILSGMKRCLRAHLIGRGTCLLLAAVVAAVFVTLAIDYPLRLDRLQRAVIDLLAGAGLGYVMWRVLLRPLRVPMGAEEMALVLEKHYPHLEDRLISTQQFGMSRRPAAGASEALIRKVAQQAHAMLGSVRLRDVVESAGTWKRIGWLGGAAAVLVAFTVWQPTIMKQWFFRNVLLADVAYPQQTYLRIEGGPDFRVVRGGNLTVTVSSEGAVIPTEVTFHMKFPGMGKVERIVPGTGPDGDVFVKTFEDVSDEFTFYVTGNDDRTGRCRVTVASRPELVFLSGAMFFPGYMNRPGGEPFSAARGVISVPPGTTLSLVGRANKDLERARLMLDGKAVATMRILEVPSPDDPDGPVRPRGVKGTLRIPERVEPNRLDLRFELLDTEGVINPEGAAYTLRIARDGPPRVTMSRRFVRSEVTPWARIPLILKASDDHGVAGMVIDAGIEAPAGKTATAPATAPAPVLQAVSAGPDGYGGRQVETGYDLMVEQLNARVGQLVRVQAIASDTLPESFGGPNSGSSPVQIFKIVSEDELLAQLVRRQMEVRQDFATTVERQAQVRDKLLAVGDRVRTIGADVEVARGLHVATADQRRVAAQCAVAAQRLQAVADEMDCNRLVPNERRRLAERVIAPLSEICKKPMNDVIQEMDRASKSSDADELGRFTADCVVIAGGFYKRLEHILAEMKELESRQALISQLKIILKSSEDIRRKLKEDADRQADSLLNKNNTEPTP